MQNRHRPLMLAGLLALAAMMQQAWGQDGVSRSRETALTAAIKLVSPAVAGINVIKLQKGPSAYGLLFNDPFWSKMFPESYRRVESLGSGVVISSDGYVVTNAHVVENAAEIIVTLPGGRQFDVQDVYTDPLTDIALLKIDAKNLPVVKLGDSDDLLIGEWAIALGNPLGLFDVSMRPTATVGIISGLNMDFGHKEPGRVYQDMIQTDAAINPGNSGGPLVNAQGEVIGLNSFIFTESEFSAGSIGIGFAVPVNRVKEVVEELRTKGRVDRSFSTGLVVQPVDRNIGRYLGLSPLRGVFIKRVDPGSAGERAGVQPGDVLLEVNRRPVNNRRDFLDAVEEDLLRAGDAIMLVIWRDGATRTLTMILGA